MKATNGYCYPAKLLKRKGNHFTIQLLATGKVYRVTVRNTRPYNWKVGTKISCNWKNKGKFYSGKIGAIKTKLFNIYNDGDKEWANIGQCLVNRC